MKAVRDVSVPTDLYNDLRAMLGDIALSGKVPDGDEFLRVYGQLKDIVDDDWCEDDGANYCGNHDDFIAYRVDNFGPEGRVLRPSEVTEDAVCFPVCPSSQYYDEAKDM